MEWMQERVANREYYNQLKQIWDSSKELATRSSVDEELAWQHFRRRVVSTAPAPVEPVYRRFSLMKIAAAVLLLIGLSVLTYQVMNREKMPKEMIASSGQAVLTDTLPDGSVITLNKRSSLQYPSAFRGKKRAVELKGEAFFKVTPDKDKPFIITINEAEVMVLGTSFNIKGENGNTEVVVETGVVRVTNAGKAVELTAGEKLSIRAHDSVFAKETVSDQLYNYYRSREFVCDNTPLWKLVNVLNEAYDARIVIGRKELFSAGLAG